MPWDDLLRARYPLPWLMTPAERLSLIALLHTLRPRCAIEVGTAAGGSLQVLADFSDRVFALDWRFAVPDAVRTQLSHVAFVEGDSHQTLPALMRRLHREGIPVGFVLIDGDHSYAGVKQDIEAVIAAPPLTTCYLVLHDSFNPEVRQGMRDAAWTSSPYVQSVELDFVQGWFHSQGIGPQREMWGGFALAILSPEPRVGTLTIQESLRPLFEQMVPVSAHPRQRWAKRWPRSARVVGLAETVLEDPAGAWRKATRRLGRPAQ